MHSSPNSNASVGHSNGSHGQLITNTNGQTPNTSALYANHSNLNYTHGSELVVVQSNSNYNDQKSLEAVTLATRFICFGTYRTSPHKDGVCFREEYLTLTVKDDPSSYSSILPNLKNNPNGRPYAFKIGWQNILKIEYRSEGQESVIFLTVTESCAKKICMTFGLPDNFVVQSRLPYFSPESEHVCHRLLTIRFETPNYDWEYSLRLLLLRFTQTSGKAPSIRRASLEEARQIISLLPAIDITHSINSALNDQRFSYDPFQRPHIVRQQFADRQIRPIVYSPYQLEQLMPQLTSNSGATQTLSYQHCFDASQPKFHIQATISVPNRSTLLTVEEALEQVIPSTDNNGGHVTEKPVQQKAVLISTQRLLNISNRNLLEVMLPFCKKLKADAHPESLEKKSSIESDQQQKLSHPTDEQAGMTPGDIPAYLKGFHLVYPIPTLDNPSTKDSITVSSNDISCLEPDTFLNDIIIDFYLKFVHNEFLDQPKRRKVYIFNSFFYGRLTSKTNSFNSSCGNQPTTSSMTTTVNEIQCAAPVLDRQAKAAARHKLVRSWTKNINIFDIDFVVIPINENAHWYLAIICYPGAQQCPVDYITKTVKVEKVEPVQLGVRRTKKMSDFEAEADDDDPMAPISSSVVANVSNPSMTQNVASEPTATAGEDDEYSEEANEEKFQQQIAEGLVQAPVKTEPKIDKMPCIIIMDSLQSDSPRYKTVGILRDYLTHEFSAKNPGAEKRNFDRTTCRGVYPKVPQQDNYSDCGLYVLQYAESFLTNPPQDFGSAELPLLLRRVCDSECVKNKRAQIRNLLLKLTNVNV